MFRERLEGLLERVEGSQSVALISGDGIPVESVLADDDDDDLETLAAETVTQVRGMAANHGEFGLGGVRQLTLETADRTIMLGKLPEDHYLLLLLEAGSATGRARYELRRAWMDFEPDLV